MTPLARLTFGALVLATIGAFFVTQRLKRSPPVIQRANFGPLYFSPDHNGYRDEARVVFRLKRADEVTVSVVGPGGDAVRELASSRSISGGERVDLPWNGREDDGHIAPDGRYRVRLVLTHAGRSVFLPGQVKLDLTPPKPAIVRVSGRDAASAKVPLIVRAGRATPVAVTFRGSTQRPSILEVERTDLPHPRIVSRTNLRAVTHDVTWDGRVDGKPAPAGIYRLRVRVRDKAGNVAVSPARAPGIGVTVRALAVQPPLGSHTAGSRLTFYVDSRGRPYRWAVRRVGAAKVLERGRGRGYRLRLRAPLGASCACVMTVSAGRDAMRIPFAVTARRHHPVLIVLPALSWIADDLTDEDGNGVPNTLANGELAALRRPFPGLPATFLGTEGRLIAHLDGQGDAYDLTTDAALAVGSGPKLAGHRGVLLAGREEWLPRRTQAALRRYVEGGGRIASFSVRSLRRSAVLSNGAQPALLSPTRLAATDALGSRFGPVVRKKVTLTVFRQNGGLFDTVSGLFPGWRAYEATRSVGSGTLEAAAGPDPQTRVIVAYGLGKGQVYRAGLPGFTARIGPDVPTTDLTDQAWSLLSR